MASHMRCTTSHIEEQRAALQNNISLTLKSHKVCEMSRAQSSAKLNTDKAADQVLYELRGFCSFTMDAPKYRWGLCRKAQAHTQSNRNRNHLAVRCCRCILEVSYRNMRSHYDLALLSVPVLKCGILA